MQNSSFSADGIQFAWDASSLKLWQECPFKYYLKMVEGWGGASDSPHLRFGSIYASSLEHFHKLRADGLPYWEAAAEIVRRALLDSWDHERDDAGARVPGSGAAWDSGHHLKNRETLLRSIIWYFDQYEDDPMTTYVTAEGRPAVEFSFTLPVEDGIVFCGHIDRLVEYQDRLMVQDQKTTGSTLSQYYFDQYSPDTQMSMYTFAGQAIYSAPVAGVVIDAAQIAVGFTRYDRGLTYRTKAQLEEWYEDTMLHIAAAQRATREREFPMNTTACGNYGGCQFRRICSRSPEVRMNFLRGDFERGHVWDPLKRR